MPRATLPGQIDLRLSGKRAPDARQGQVGCCPGKKLHRRDLGRDKVGVLCRIRDLQNEIALGPACDTEILVAFAVENAYCAGDAKGLFGQPGGKFDWEHRAVCNEEFHTRVPVFRSAGPIELPGFQTSVRAGLRQHDPSKFGRSHGPDHASVH